MERVYKFLISFALCVAYVVLVKCVAPNTFCMLSGANAILASSVLFY